MRITFSSQQSLPSQLEEKIAECNDEVIDFSENSFGKKPVEELIKMIEVLAGSGKKITTVDLSKTGIHLKSGEELARIIHAFSKTQVKTLILTGNWLGLIKSETELKEIMQALVDTGVITTIDLSNNSFSSLKREELKTILPILNKPHIFAVHLDDPQLHKLGGSHDVGDLLFECLGTKLRLSSADSFTKIMGLYLDQRAEAATGNKEKIYYISNPNPVPSEDRQSHQNNIQDHRPF